MNNGRVRIYDLSKELDLDNKDILDICSQLNIAVKTHSSTITESEAERIREAAQRYKSSRAGRTSNHHAANTDNGDNGAGRALERNKIKKKQQILAVHKQNRPADNGQGETTGSAPALSGPPRPPVRPQPPKPLPTAVQEVQVEDSIDLAVPPLPEPSLGNGASEAETETRRPPQLQKPPARSDQEQPRIAKTDRPLPAKGEIAAPVAPKPAIITRLKPERSESLPLRPAAPAKKAEPPESKSEEPRPKLQRPQRPKPPEEIKPTLEKTAIVPEADAEEPLEDITELTQEQKRLKLKLKTPGVPVKTGKQSTWEDEEEESLEAKKAKASKTGKNKRRSLIEDDDDIFDSVADGASTLTQATLSIARPPKPKQQTQQPAKVATAKKFTKKPAAKTETPASSSNSSKADRREKKLQPPERVILPENFTVQELAELIQVPETEIITKFFLRGIAVNITQTIDREMARSIVEEMGIAIDTPEEKAAAIKNTEMLDAEDLENLQLRPPVVTIMGHVDHGKTTLLDSIRKTKVAQGEAGGITQHIGAYHVDIEYEGEPRQIVFLDTPGHEAFTAMRARGARVTDIAVLVVAADDGVRPQTREAISHARAAEVPIVVAINKIDKPGAEPERVKQELTELNLVPEEWGGETVMVPVSALTGENLDTLLENLIIVADIEELSANPDRLARGTVIEANLDRTRGPVATLLVQNGTLGVGDIIVIGSVFGKIRAMIDDRGDRVEAATPSFAVEVLGLNEVPAAGEEFEVFSNEKEARSVADRRAQQQRQTRLQQMVGSRRISLSSLSAQVEEGQLKELNLILKADVQGSVEAIVGSLKQLPQKEVQVRVLLAAPGEITETDVDLASASGAVIVGFNTTLASGAGPAADREGVDVRQYDVIYKLLDEIQGAMEGLLDPEEVEEGLGVAEVRAVFPVGRGMVAGCYVQSGKVIRNRLLRVRRGNEVVFEGILDSLKRIREDVREVNAGYECGINSDKFNDWQVGDSIEVYEKTYKRRKLTL